jgi:hypothetical protein
MKTEKCSICNETNLRSMIGIDGRCQKCLENKEDKKRRRKK